MAKIAVLLLVLLIAQGMLADDSEYRLMRYLMTNYDKSVRPSKNASESLNVTFGLILTQLVDVDERNQILTTNCWLKQMWIDNNLQWNQSDFGGIEVTRIPAEKVWKPDIILYNNADSQYNSALLTSNIIVSSDGNLTWYTTAIVKSLCLIDVEYFPFDEQSCKLKFSSWTYDGSQLNLIIPTKAKDLTDYVANGEWNLIDIVFERNVVYYSCCKEPFPDVTITIIFRRRPLFYVFNLVLPCVLITGIALMSFYMPSDSGEKVTLGITTLLSITVFLMVIGESMPPTSEKLPLIGIYYGVTIILVSLATGLAVVTLNIHHRGMRGTEVPKFVKKIVLGLLAKMLFIKLQTPDLCNAESAKANINIMELPSSSDMTSSDHITETDIAKNDANSRLSPRFGTRLISSRALLSLDNLERQIMRVLNRLYQAIEKNEMRLTEQERKDAVKLEWQQVALIIDRFLLWIFIISTVGATFGILYMSPHSRLF